jgi:hypothetical protein
MPPRTRKATAPPKAADTPPKDTASPKRRPPRPRGNHGQFVRALTTAERDARAAELKGENWTYDEIAKEVGYANKSSACRAVQRALKAAVVPAANALRIREFARLELLWEALEPGIEAGDVKAITEARKISESLRRLFDLDGAIEAGQVDDEEKSSIEQLLAEANRIVDGEQAKIYRSANAGG